MTLTTERMQQIIVDVELDRPRTDYTTEENKFRDKIEPEMAEARAKGGGVEFTSELPELRAMQTTPEARRRWLKELARLATAAQLEIEARGAGEEGHE